MKKELCDVEALETVAAEKNAKLVKILSSNLGCRILGKPQTLNNKIAGTNSGETLRAQIEGALNCGL